MHWMDEFWKLFAAYGVLWNRNELAQKRADRAESALATSVDTVNTLTGQNATLRTRNRRLHEANLELQTELDAANSGTSGGTDADTAQVLAAYHEATGQ